MLVMDQKFSIIMTGTGVVALAGIVVNNNIRSDRHFPGALPADATTWMRLSLRRNSVFVRCC